MKITQCLSAMMLGLGAVLSLGIAVPQAVAQSYRVVKIADNATATDINEDSDVCGYFLDTSNPNPGFVFGTYGGGNFIYTGKHRLIAFSPGGYYIAHSQGADLFIRPPDGIFNAGLFDGATIGMRMLPANFTVYDVNDDGIVVGSRPLPGGTLSHKQAFSTSLWAQSDTYLNAIAVWSSNFNITLNFEFSYATCINNAGKTGVQGHVTGQSGIETGTHSGISTYNNPALRTENFVSYIEDINANNVCAGRYYNNAALFAEKYPNAPLVRMANITPEGVSGHPSWALGLNDKNEAVGWYTPGQALRCFLYTNGQTKDVESLIMPTQTKWHIENVWDINNKGDIAATATYDIKTAFGWVIQSPKCAVLLKRQ